MSMDKSNRIELAHNLQDKVSSLLERMSELLAEEGIRDVRVESFTVRPKGDKARVEEFGDSFAADCPTRCVVLPDGTIRCFPDCG